MGIKNFITLIDTDGKEDVIIHPKSSKTSKEVLANRQRKLQKKQDLLKSNRQKKSKNLLKKKRNMPLRLHMKKLLMFVKIFNIKLQRNLLKSTIQFL